MIGNQRSKEMKKLQGKVALVTGGSKGLGVHIARALAKEGAHLVLVARSEGLLEEVKADLSTTGVKIHTIAADVTDIEGQKGWLDEAEAVIGPIDILVNNAGRDLVHPFASIAPEALDQILDLNIRAPMHLARLVLKGMSERGSGHIVNVASLAGLSGVAYAESYCATKHALVGFTRALRASLHGTGVSATALCPGYLSEEGMFARQQQEYELTLPVLLQALPPKEIAKHTIRAIKKDAADVIYPSAPRFLLALSLLFPRFGEWVARKIGAHDAFTALVRAEGLLDP